MQHGADTTTHVAHSLPRCVTGTRRRQRCQALLQFQEGRKGMEGRLHKVQKRHTYISSSFLKKLVGVGGSFSQKLLPHRKTVCDTARQAKDRKVHDARHDVRSVSCFLPKTWLLMHVLAKRRLWFQYQFVSSFSLTLSFSFSLTFCQLGRYSVYIQCALRAVRYWFKATPVSLPPPTAGL